MSGAISLIPCACAAGSIQDAPPPHTVTTVTPHSTFPPAAQGFEATSEMPLTHSEAIPVVRAAACPIFQGDSPATALCSQGDDVHAAYAGAPAQRRLVIKRASCDVSRPSSQEENMTGAAMRVVLMHVL